MRLSNGAAVVLPPYDNGLDGRVSFVSWQNSHTLNALSVLFGVKENEVITKVEFSRDGISAQIEFKK